MISRDAAPSQKHSRCVTVFTLALARALGLPREQIDVIARGAYLHDIGKMALSADIWSKPGKLTEEEKRVAREHAYHGFKLLSQISFLAEPAEIVYSHHENHDGSGYPRGLRRSEIPLGARIVAIANTLDVITSDQPYRRAQTFEAAREEIQRWSGCQFDPQMVELFLSMPHDIWEDLRNQV